MGSLVLKLSPFFKEFSIIFKKMQFYAPVLVKNALANGLKGA